MKKVLIITYYWPPSGGAGVQRWLKFVKYLREFGIEPVVYTVKDPNYAVIDESLFSEIPNNIEIIKQPIWEPYKLASFFSRGNKKVSAGFLEKKTSTIGKMTNYIRANYFIPDARKFWIKPSVNYLLKYLKENNIDTIISTGPPHSLHIIALKLKSKINLKWISDFRDPWTDIDYHHQLPLTNRSKKKHFALEKLVLNNSNAVIVVGETMKQNYLDKSNNIHVITNGFDEVIDGGTIQELDSKFTISHIGMMNKDRNPNSLWKALSELVKTNENFAKDLQIKLIGKVSEKVLDDLKKYKLDNNFELIDYLPHAEVIQHQKKSQVLLLAVNNVPSAKGIITGKIFEYLMAKRPILSIGVVGGDLDVILKETNAGVVIDFNDEESMKSTILKLYKDYKKDELVVQSRNLENYHRKYLTKRLSEIIHNLNSSK